MDKKIEATQFQETHRVDRRTRPVYHATPPTGWMNDPNGFSIYDGKIHLFYQYHPYKDIWGPMHWGHCTSTDYVSWDDLPVALAPDVEYDASGCFSGSALTVDGRHALVYTGCEEREHDETVQSVNQQQCLAYGDGVDYIKRTCNPIIPISQLPEGYQANDFRDPKVWEQDGLYLMVAAAKDNDGFGHVLMYDSEDLENWKFRSSVTSSDGTYGDMWECPDLFRLDGSDVLTVSCMNVKNSPRGFHDGFGVIACLGDMDWDSGTLDIKAIQAVDQGADFYATQSLLTPDGRRIMIAWMQAWHNFIKPSHQKWHGMMTFPRELSVVDGRLIQKPVRELEQAYTNKVREENIEVSGGAEIEVPGVHGRAIDMTIDIIEADCKSFAISFDEAPDRGMRFTWIPKENRIVCNRILWGASEHTTDLYAEQTILLPESDSLPKLRFLVDRASVELFINDGVTVFSSTFYAPLEADSIMFSADGTVRMNIEKHDIDPEKARSIRERTVSLNEKTEDQAGIN